MDINDMAEVMSVWGPFGVAVILIVIVEEKLRRRLDNADNDNRKMYAYLYVSNWVLIAILLFSGCVFWYLERARPEVVAEDVVRDIVSPYRLNSSADGFFVKKKNNSWTYNVEWKLFGESTPKTVEVRLEDDEKYFDYELVIGDDGRVVWDRVWYENDALWIEKDGEKAELNPVGSASRSLPISSGNDAEIGGWFIAGAYASGEVVSGELLRSAINSNDSYMRHKASMYLAENADVLMPLIEEVILSETSVNAARIVGVSALVSAYARLRSVDKRLVVSDDVEKKIAEYSIGENELLAMHSRVYVSLLPNEKYSQLFANVCGEEVEHKEGVCEGLEIDVIYNKAMAARSSAKGKDVALAVDDITNAINSLDWGFELGGYFGSDDSRLFKLMYAKALLQYELSELLVDNTYEANIYMSCAYVGFSAFVAAVETGRITSYEYPHQLHYAKCYLNGLNGSCFNVDAGR